MREFKRNRATENLQVRRSARGEIDFRYPMISAGSHDWRHKERISGRHKFGSAGRYAGQRLRNARGSSLVRGNRCRCL
jgi:hypothetical protein